MSLLRRSYSYFLKRPRPPSSFGPPSSVEGFEQTESVGVVVVEAELRHHATAAAAAATRSTLGRHVLMIGDLGWGRGSIKAIDRTTRHIVGNALMC